MRHMLFGAHLTPQATAALLWWIIPIVAVSASIIYVIWVGKFQSKYENETHRATGKFSSFQKSFRDSHGHHQPKNVRPIQRKNEREN
jgi:hypothetical protein